MHPASVQESAVHGLSSFHFALLSDGSTESVPSLQLYVTQALPGGIVGTVPGTVTQFWVALQICWPSQYRPSSHAALLIVWMAESVASSHVSVVHAMPSLMFGGVPAWHPANCLHHSAPLQYLLSVHFVSSVGPVQPWFPLQWSFSVHGNPSSQTFVVGSGSIRQPPVPGWHLFLLQVVSFADVHVTIVDASSTHR